MYIWHVRNQVNDETKIHFEDSVGELAKNL